MKAWLDAVDIYVQPSLTEGLIRSVIQYYDGAWIVAVYVIVLLRFAYDGAFTVFLYTSSPKF